MPLDWTLITPETLQALELDTLLQHVKRRTCFDFAQRLAHLRNQHSDWTPAQSACLEFVFQVASMRLQHDQTAEPFGPTFQMGDGRSATPADFPREMLLAAYPWASALQDAELRARFLDTLWVQGKHVEAAKQAVGAYVESAEYLLDPKDWTASAQRLERALRLAASLGKGGSEFREDALAKVLGVVRQFEGTDPLYLTMRLIRLLLEFRHGDATELAKYAVTAAQTSEAQAEFRRAADYFGLAADCCRCAQLPDEQATHQRAAAESLVKEANAALGQPGRGAIVAASVLSSAVQAMRQAPGGKSRAEELRAQLAVLQEKALTELKSVSTNFDATEMVQDAVRRVSGKSFGDAVLAFGQLAKPPSVDALQQQVRDAAKVAILESLTSVEIINARGHVTAKVPSLEVGAADPSQPGLRWRMFRCAGINRTVTVQATIAPARKTILHEHAPDRAAVLELIRYSPWIPDGHHESITKAIVAGLHGDMLVAGYIAPIQFEAVIRQAVECTGGPGPMLKPDGTQEERTLSALLDLPQATSIFGDAGVLELQDLLIDPLGSNLRNEVAHGLLADSGFFISP